MNSRGPASAGGQWKLDLGGSIHLDGRLLIVARLAVGIHSVLVSVHGEVSFRQERQVDFEIARRPVGHGPDIPVVAVSPRDNYVLCNARIEQFSFVPLGWHCRKK